MPSAVVGLLRVLLTANTAEFSSAMRSASAEMSKLSKDLNSMGRQMTSIGTSLTKTLTLPLLAVGAGSAKLAIDFESSFAGVRKTVEATDKEFADLAQGFRNLAKTIPVNVNELNKIGEAAGALGIKKGDILEFSSVMAQLGVTTNLTSDQAATSIAQIQNIFNASGKDTKNFASALVALGNAGASTESQIVDFASRLAGAGHQIGLSQQSVLGFSSALANMGLNAELGGTALSTVMSKMSVAVDTGGAKLEGFAKVAGMTGEAFKTLFKTDPTEAILRFTEGLSKAGTSGENLTIILKDLGLKGSNVQDVMKRLAGGAGQMRDAVELSAKAWKENTALTEEARKRFETTESQMKLLWNRIQDVGITIGNALLPTIKTLISVFGSLVPVLEKIASFFAMLPDSAQTLIIALAGLLGGAGPVVYVFGQLITSAGNVAAAFGKKGIATRLLGKDLDALGTSSTKTTGFLGFLGKAASVAGAALAGWEIGRLISNLLGLDNQIDRTINRIEALERARKGVGAGGRAGDVDLAAKERELAAAVQDGNKALAGRLSKDIEALKNDQTRLAMLDSIALAIKRGAEETINYTDAVKFNAQWLVRQHASHKEFTDSIQRTEKATEALTNKLDEQAKKLEAADDQIAELSKTAKAKLTEAIKSGVFSVKELAEASGLSEMAIKRFTDQIKESAKAGKVHEKALKDQAKATDELASSMDTLTDDQIAQIEGLLNQGRAEGDIVKSLKVTKTQVNEVQAAQKRRIEAEKDAAAERLEIHKHEVDAAEKEMAAFWDAMDQNEKLAARSKELGLEGTALKLQQIETQRQAEIKSLKSSDLFYDDSKRRINEFYDHQKRLALGTADTIEERMALAGIRTKAYYDKQLKQEQEFLNFMLLHSDRFTDEEIKNQRRRVAAAKVAAGDIVKIWGDAVAEMGNQISRLGGMIDGALGHAIASLGGLVTGFGQAESAVQKYQKAVADGTATTMQAVSAYTGMVGVAISVWKAVITIADKLDGMAGAFGESAMRSDGTLRDFQLNARLAGQDLDKLFDIKDPHDYEVALAGVNRAIADNKRMMDAYGLTWKDFSRMTKEFVNQTGKDLARDFKNLTDRGVSETKAIQGMGKALSQLVIDAIETGQKIPAALQPILEKLIRMGGLTEEAARAMLGLAEDTMPSLAEVTAAAERYGLKLDELGPKVKQLSINEAAKQIVKDFDILTRAGVPLETLMRDIPGGFREQVQGLVTDALTLGLTLPEAMKPILQKLVDAGYLTDQFGTKLTDLDDLKFEKPLSEAIDDLILKIGDLIDTIKGIGDEFERSASRARGAAEQIGTAIPRPGTTSGGTAAPRPGDQPPDLPDVDPNQPDTYTSEPIAIPRPGYATGGVVSSYFATGGVGARILRFIPKGTDTVPAMLTPGEGVLNVRAMKWLGQANLDALNTGQMSSDSATVNSTANRTVIFQRGAFEGLVVDSPERVRQFAKEIAKEIHRGGDVLDAWKGLPLGKGA